MASGLGRLASRRVDRGARRGFAGCNRADGRPLDRTDDDGGDNGPGTQYSEGDAEIGVCAERRDESRTDDSANSSDAISDSDARSSEPR